MAGIQDITAVVPVADIDAAVAFFRDVLGFELRTRFDGFAHLSRGGGALRLISSGGPGVALDDPARQQGIYVDIRGLDAHFAKLAPSLAQVDHRPPFDQPYGQREFHVWYGGLQIIFGEPQPKEVRHDHT